MLAIKKSYLTVFLIICFSFQNCIYDYNPDLEKYEDLLVVYGMITDNYGPHQVILSWTTSVYGYSNLPETGANVKISDLEGNIVDLTDQGNGIYLTPADFKGENEKKYKILIELSDGRHYESDYVELLDVPEIKELNFEFTSKTDQKTAEEIAGYQFYVSTDGNNENQKYYRWEIFETWEIKMPYFITNFWTGDSLISVSFPQRCWHYSKVNEIFIANTLEYQTNSIKNFPLNFTSVETERLAIKYRLTVNQFSMTEKSYFFWKGQIENTQQKGSLYEKQPYQVVGNIRCIENPKEIVLGIFEASSVAQKEIFVAPPHVFVPSGFESCSAKDPSDLTDMEKRRYYYASYTMMDSLVVFNKGCVDCTTSGAKPTMPENWDISGN
ncbi:MAG: DUF4249 domain-containing protein [Bacteroidales bacterium]